MATVREIAMGLRAACWVIYRQTIACFTRYKITTNQSVLPALPTEEDGITQELVAFQPEQVELVVFLKRITKKLIQADTTVSTAKGGN